MADGTTIEATSPSDPDDNDDADATDALIDEASMDSFPASDPPSFWARSSSDRSRSARGQKSDVSDRSHLAGHTDPPDDEVAAGESAGH